MADFPPAGIKEDSKFHFITYEDNIARHQTEGGYQVSRPRTTRRPSRLITTGFLWLTTAQMESIDDFIASVNYGATAFSYEIPSTGEVVNVQIQAPIKWKYVGMGSARRWESSDITLREV